MTLLDGIRTAAFQPKAVGVAVGLGFRDRVEPQQVEGLLGAVDHGRNAKGTLATIALGYVDSAQWLGPVATPTQQGKRISAVVCGPGHPIDAGSLRTRITDDSQDGQGAARKRVSEQINQSFDLMPFALTHGLHDTRLEPTNRALDLLPVDGMPVHRRVGSRTSRCCHRRQVCVAPSGQLAKVLS
jgi:hypothetical protein